LLEKITEFFYQKFVVSYCSSYHVCCKNIASNDFGCKTKFDL